MPAEVILHSKLIHYPFFDENKEIDYLTIASHLVRKEPGKHSNQRVKIIT